MLDRQFYDRGNLKVGVCSAVTLKCPQRQFSGHSLSGHARSWQVYLPTSPACPRPAQSTICALRLPSGANSGRDSELASSAVVRSDLLPSQTLPVRQPPTSPLLLCLRVRPPACLHATLIIVIIIAASSVVRHHLIASSSSSSSLCVAHWRQDWGDKEGSCCLKVACPALCRPSPLVSCPSDSQTLQAYFQLTWPALRGDQTASPHRSQDWQASFVGCQGR